VGKDYTYIGKPPQPVNSKIDAFVQVSGIHADAANARNAPRDVFVQVHFDAYQADFDPNLWLFVPRAVDIKNNSSAYYRPYYIMIDNSKIKILGLIKPGSIYRLVHQNYSPILVTPGTHWEMSTIGQAIIANDRLDGVRGNGVEIIYDEPTEYLLKLIYTNYIEIDFYF